MKQFKITEKQEGEPLEKSIRETIKKSISSADILEIAMLNGIKDQSYARHIINGTRSIPKSKGSKKKEVKATIAAWWKKTQETITKEANK